MTKKEMFEKGLRRHKKINIKDLTSSQRQGRMEFGNIVRQWINEYQFETIKKVIGAINDELRNAENELKIYIDYLAVETNPTYKKDLQESVEKWSMVVNCLKELVVEIQA